MHIFNKLQVPSLRFFFSRIFNSSQYSFDRFLSITMFRGVVITLTFKSCCLSWSIADAGVSAGVIAVSCIFVKTESKTSTWICIGLINMSDFRVADLIVQWKTKLTNTFSQKSNYGYLNSTKIFVMVTATINANVKLEIHLDILKRKNLKANRG